MSFGKPIKIVKVPGGYNVFLRDVPLVQGDGGKGVTLDRARAGLSTTGFKGGWKPPLSTEPILIKKAGDASSLAHQIGRYMLNMGDFVFAYAELVGIEGNHETWWNRANR
jgi:hypothetical protein